MTKDDAETLVKKELNRVARERLVNLISQRMHLINSAIVWELKYGLDEAEFARNKALSEPMDEVQSHLDAYLSGNPVRDPAPPRS